MKQMELQVKTSGGGYGIRIENGLFDGLAEELCPIVDGGKLFVVTDDTVDGIYGTRLKKQLTGIDYAYLVLPHGEQTKCLSVLGDIYRAFAAAGLSRTDCVLAFGGGVIGDITGFAAATYLRGVKYVGMPTTLLSQVDSSVGGKVAVDLDEGKNLVGSFYAPCRVLIDPELLQTLPARVFRDGMAEVIKYGAIRDAALFDTLCGEIDGKLPEIIARCVDIKREIVERDEFDTGERMLLNFGHTFGHVVEKLGNYETYTHGEGVAIGMLRITQKSEAMGKTLPGTAKKLRGCLEKYGLVFDGFTFDRDAAQAVMVLDKKSTRNTIRYVILDRIGCASVMELPKEDTFLLD